MSGRLKFILRGALPSFDSISAPNMESGSVILAIGRFLSDSSPVSVHLKRKPARIPERSRIVVPLLPQSITGEKSFGERPFRPTPCIKRWSPFSSIFTPSVLMAFIVEMVSSARSGLNTFTSPSQREPKMMALCVMDLSLGRINSPEMLSHFEISFSIMAPFLNPF